MTRSIINTVGTFAALWITIVVTSAIAVSVLNFDEQVAANDGPVNTFGAFLIVNALHALVLTFIVARSNIGRWRLGMLVSFVFFVGQSFLLLMEAVYFASSVEAPMDTLYQSAFMNLSIAIMAGTITGLLRRNDHNCILSNMSVPEIVANIGLIGSLYVAIYFTAGFLIAWSVPEVRSYYGDGQTITLSSLIAFQFLRGGIWAVLAIALVNSMKPGVILSALLIGVTFSVLASAQLLYPNSLMPWEVRLAHLIEVGVSNFVFGFLGALLIQAKLLRTAKVLN